MVWKLGDLCLQCIQENLRRYPNLGSNLPNVYKEILIERLACHDKFFPDLVPQIRTSLFAASIRHINLQRCDQITDDVLKLLRDSGCKLEVLKLIALNSITDVGVQDVVQNQNELLIVHLKDLPAISENILKYIKSPNLWSFKLTHPNKAPKQQWISDSALALFCQNNPSIKKLKLSTSIDHLPVIAKGLNSSIEYLNLNYQTVEDEGIEILAENCPNLKKLDLNGARSVGKEAAIKMFQACTQMEDLDLGYCTKLASVLERQVFWTLPQSLKVLSLVGLNLEDEEIFVECITRLPSVTNLRLCGVTALNDSTIQKIVEKIGPKLTELNLSGMGPSDVTDEGLKYVTQHCTQLEGLHISLLRLVTGVSLLPIFSNPSRAARIKSLSVNSKMMEANVLDQVVSSCPNLEFIHFSGLTIVTDAVIMSLADHAPKLNNIGLRACKMLTDKSICYLSGRCPLKSLVLSGLQALTDKSIFCIASSCPQLEEIYLNGCAQISPVAVRYLQDQCLKRLKVNHAIPNASPNQLMGKNLDTGEFCRLDLL